MSKSRGCGEETTIPDQAAVDSGGLFSMRKDKPRIRL